MNTLTAADWSDMTDEELRQGLGIVLIAVTDPRCEPDVADEIMAFGQNIRDELARRIAARKGGRMMTTEEEEQLMAWCTAHPLLVAHLLVVFNIVGFVLCVLLSPFAILLSFLRYMGWADRYDGKERQP